MFWKADDALGPMTSQLAIGDSIDLTNEQIFFQAAADTGNCDHVENAFKYKVAAVYPLAGPTTTQTLNVNGGATIETCNDCSHNTPASIAECAGEVASGIAKTGYFADLQAQSTLPPISFTNWCPNTYGFSTTNTGSCNQGYRHVYYDELANDATMNTKV